jgi:Catalytic LigB subunit of aromatic ring-opening dioxygenase
MGKIVTALATSHTPSIFANRHTTDDPKWRRIHAGFDTLRRHLQAGRPDVLLWIWDDHIHNFFYNQFPAFGIGVASQYKLYPEGALTPPWESIPGHAELGMYLAEEGLRAGFDWTIMHEAAVDHGVTVPMPYLCPEHNIPIVPIFVNCLIPPLPTPKRCYELGQCLGQAVQRWPGTERIGLIATGGLSHDLVSEKQGFVDEEIDREVLRLLGEGPRAALAEISDERMVQSGNGTAEIRNWIVLAGALPEQARGTIVAYEAMAITGTAQAIFDCDG